MNVVIDDISLYIYAYIYNSIYILKYIYMHIFLKRSIQYIQIDTVYIYKYEYDINNVWK